MKNSLKKLRGLALPKHERHLEESLTKLDELSMASQDMQDMRACYDHGRFQAWAHMGKCPGCRQKILKRVLVMPRQLPENAQPGKKNPGSVPGYDSLLSAAAATANSAYEFSESLREMGDCLLEKTALNDDEESGKVLLMLGKAQFVIQNLVDCYRSHIFQTITIPSESLLNELHIVEEMKKQCDEKRRVFEDMIPKYRGKGRLKSSKGEFFSAHELQAARDEYDEGASIFVFRMKSLKGGQSRSLLTQAARHHAAQVSFFRKALKSLEAIEPHVKFVTEKEHIAYHFNGLEDDEEDNGDNDEDDDYDDDDDDDDDDIDDDSEARDDNELSFDYGPNGQGQDISTSRDSMELDKVNLTFSKVSAMDAVEEYSHRNPGRNSFIFARNLDASSKSAPLLVGKGSDSAERFIPTRQSSTRKFYTYVLPTPDETKIPVSLRSDTQVPQTRRPRMSGGTLNTWHSSPLEHKKNVIGNEKLSGPILSNTQSVLKESNSNTTSSRLPRPMTEDLSSLLDQHGDTKKIKRQAFSGPLTGKSWSNKPTLSASGPIASTENSLLFTGSLLHTPFPQPSSSPMLSSSVSPTFMSSPKISELHELPRPPAHLASKGPSHVRHSSPLVPKGQELSATNKLMPNATSSLPLPPQTIPRSYSIPSRGQIAMELHMRKNLETPQNFKMAEDIASPQTISRSQLVLNLSPQLFKSEK